MNSYTPDTTAEEVAADCQAQISMKTILVTGASPGGLGATFATVIAKYSPACIILATRDMGKAEETAREIASASPSVRTICIELHLDSFSQIREAAEKINALEEQIDVLVNNAGVMAGSFSKTVDGIERQFGINHLGHFLFTNLLLAKMLARNVPIRVVSVSSEGYRLSYVRFGDWNFDVGRSYTHWAKQRLLANTAMFVD
jgi:NAD(P)-dependent dehydrogenase (short-subunit alcohol dehydrogenase family)